MDTHLTTQSFNHNLEDCPKISSETDNSSNGNDKSQQMYSSEEPPYFPDVACNTADGTRVNDGSARLTFTAEDVQDGFFRWLIGCGGSKSKLREEDTETYGFDDLEKREKTIFGRLKRQLSERRSKRSSRSQASFRRSRSQEDIHRTSHSLRQNSYKEAVNINNANVPYNDSLIKSVNRDILSDANVSHAANKYSRIPYANQTNAQSQTKPKYRKKYDPIIDPDVYTFNCPKRGYMVNIVNDRFFQQPDREGAIWDLLKMKEIGRKFGFRLFNYKYDRNLTQSQMLKLLKQVQEFDHSKCDCFMLMISTHGLEERNRAIGGKLDHALVCADDRFVFTSTVLNMFTDTNCPTLAGKPKIFFIQACRGILVCVERVVSLLVALTFLHIYSFKHNEEKKFGKHCGKR